MNRGRNRVLLGWISLWSGGWGGSLSWLRWGTKSHEMVVGVGDGDVIGEREIWK